MKNRRVFFEENRYHTLDESAPMSSNSGLLRKVGSDASSNDSSRQV